MKRKESLKSPVKQKKSRESLDGISSPAQVKPSVEEQRKRAREWADNEAKKNAAPEESTSSKAKRSATPAKKSKIVYDSDPEEVVEARPARGRKSVVSASVVEEVAAVVEKAASRKISSKAKKVQPVEESDEDSEPEPAPVAPRSARKTPAKAAKPEVKPVAKTPQTVSMKAAVTKAESPKAATPSPVPVRSPVVTPAPAASPVRAAPAAIRPRESERVKEVVEGVEQAVAHRPGQSLEPPSGFVVLMVQIYIVIGGVAYRDPQLGFLLFLAVNILANLFVMSGLNSE